MKRICSVCKIEKSLEDFYKSKIEKLGREYRCKECSRKKCKRYIDKDPESWRLRSKKWREEKVEENPNFYNERYHRFKKISEYHTKSKEDKRKKINARALVYNHIKRGKMNKLHFCENCLNDNCKIQGHHDDYDKPKEVKWLCRVCHIKADRERNKREIND